MLTRFLLKRPALSVLLCLLIIAGGVWSFFTLGRLEYPSFVIKTALVGATYPGASAQEVENEVTNVIEEEIQKMGQIKCVKSTSQEGACFIQVDIKDHFTREQLDQIWDELRRKVNDVQGKLPSGVRTFVRDDFGDVFGIFLAVSGDGFTIDEIKDYAKELKKELVLLEDVAQIELWGEQKEVIYVEFNRSQMSQIGISLPQVFALLRSQNSVEPCGEIRAEDDYIKLRVGGNLNSIRTIENLVLGTFNGKLFRLGDVAHVKRGHYEPAFNKLFYNGKPAIGLGISIVDGGNVVALGKRVHARLDELEQLRPAGMDLNYINYQSDDVNRSVDDFLINFAESILIVVGLLLVFMGVKSGMIVGGTLFVIICGTFIGMKVLGIDLQLVSLGALVIALGMLVDNAIVVTDVYQIKLERGIDRMTATLDAVKETYVPLLGATLIAVLAFLPVGLNEGNVGEFCRSLFLVIAISLMLSWGLGITLTPLLCYVRIKKAAVIREDPFDRPGYRVYRNMLDFCIRHRVTTYLSVVLLLILSTIAFSTMPQYFFPDSTRSQFYIDYFRTQSSHIDDTTADLKKLQEFISKMPEVKSVTSFVGEGAMRFVLTYNYQLPNPAFGQLLIETGHHKDIDKIIPAIDAFMRNEFPDAEPRIGRFQEGCMVAFPIEARFMGSDPAVLERLVDQAKTIMTQNARAKNVRDDWRQKIKTLKFDYSENKARRTGVTRQELNLSLCWNFNGVPTHGVIRENSELIPFITRATDSERLGLENINKALVWSSALNRYLPLLQVVDSVRFDFEYGRVLKRYRKYCRTAQCEPDGITAATLYKQLRPQIEAIELPDGYTLEWGGEHEKSSEAKHGVFSLLPLAFILMFLITALLFKTLREPLIIYITLPFAVTGVVLGLYLTQLPYGFLALLGFVGLSGMLIKNAVVLLDQINLEIDRGTPRYTAVLNASVSRLRPVSMGAGTTLLGVAPLLTHTFFDSMAATIMFGLLIATALILILVPLLYVSFFRVKCDKEV